MREEPSFNFELPSLGAGLVTPTQHCTSEETRRHGKWTESSCLPCWPSHTGSEYRSCQSKLSKRPQSQAFTSASTKCSDLPRILPSASLSRCPCLALCRAKGIYAGAAVATSCERTPKILGTMETTVQERLDKPDWIRIAKQRLDKVNTKKRA